MSLFCVKSFSTHPIGVIATVAELRPPPPFDGTGRDTEHAFWRGLTEDLVQRLKKHNLGEVPHTSKFKPWAIKTAIAFRDKERAIAFERYLKTASGRAFAKKRL